MPPPPPGWGAAQDGSFEADRNVSQVLLCGAPLPAGRPNIQRITAGEATYSLDFYISSATRDELGLTMNGRTGLIGRGLLGAVYLAQEEQTGSYVALKVIPKTSDWHRDSAQREMANARAANRMENFRPYQVPLLHATEDENAFYLIYQLVWGQSGRDRISYLLDPNNRDLSIQDRTAQLLEFIDKELEAVYALHRDGKCHGDPHRSNFLHGHGRNDPVYLIDLERLKDYSPEDVSYDRSILKKTVDCVHSLLAATFGVHLPWLQELSHCLATCQDQVLVRDILARRRREAGPPAPAW